MSKGCVEDELRELDSLVGLTSVKAEIGRLVGRLLEAQSYRARGAKIFPARRHLVFSGPAGVGKRNVAQAFGQICARLGALEKGHVITVQQADLAGVRTERKLALMRAKCAAALDGILYVKNDAFLAAGILRSTGDLRLDPVDVIIEFMLRHPGDIIVILDARPNQFDYISFHSGLARRFSETIHFSPYDAFELMQILAAKAKRFGLDLPDGLECDVFPWIVANSRRGDWRNAREITDLFNKTLSARSMRGARQRCEAFGGLDRSDFRQALASMENEMAPSPLEIYGRVPRPPLA
jgi:SpoVK/Ycf46/Vps4 family AAA+-type ATPase